VVFTFVKVKRNPQRHSPILATVLIFLFSFDLANAEEYVVNNRDSTASDQNPGTAVKPFQTIGAAVAKLHAGDTVTIKAGIYREAFAVTVSGSAEKPIVIQAAPGERVVVTGADLVKGWTKTDDLTHRPIWKKTPWSQWNDCNNSVDSLDRKSGPQLIADCVLLRRVGSLKEMTPGTFFFDAAQDGAVYLWMTPSPAASTGAQVTAKGAAWWDEPVNLASEDPNQHQIEASVRGKLVSVLGQSHVTLRGLTLRYDTAAAQDGALSVDVGPKQGIADSHDITVENCVIEFCHGRGLTCVGEHITVRGCYMRRNGASGAGGRLRDSLWEDNVLDGNTTFGHSVGWEAGGVKFLFTNGLTVRRCQFINNFGPGLWFDTGNFGNVIERNFCAHNEGPGIMLEVSPDFASDDPGAKPVVTLRAGDDPSETKQISVGPTIVRNNVCVANCIQGWGIGILLQLASDTYVLNNTIVGNSQFGIFVRYHPYDPKGHRCVDNVLLNNLCVDNGANGGDQIEMTPNPIGRPGYVARNRSDYNLFWSSDAWLARNPANQQPLEYPNEAQFAKWGKTQFNGNYSAEETFKILGREEHSIQYDPMLVSPATLDYRLLPGSPAIGTGTATPEVTDDFLGRKRPSDRSPSIGALEYSPGDDSPPLMPMREREETR
jgi:hypothetical protein